MQWSPTLSAIQAFGLQSTCLTKNNGELIEEGGWAVRPSEAYIEIDYDGFQEAIDDVNYKIRDVLAREAARARDEILAFIENRRILNPLEIKVLTHRLSSYEDDLVLGEPCGKLVRVYCSQSWKWPESEEICGNLCAILNPTLKPLKERALVALKVRMKAWINQVGDTIQHYLDDKADT